MQKHRHTPLQKYDMKKQSCSLDTRLSILHALPFFKKLSHQAIEEINNIFQVYDYQKGQVIYFSGDASTQLSVVALGNVKLLKHSPSGQDVLIDILKQGDFFGTLEALGQKTYQETAEAQTNCCILKISSQQFRQILQEYPLTALNVIDIISERLKSAYEMMKQLSVQPVEQRIAFTLLKLGEKLGEQKNVGLLIQLPLSRADLAGMTGTTTETTSRIMSQLHKQGIIRSGRQWVAISDLKRLEQLAEYPD